eukprot:CAMPEP_0179416164 /NCGR_PEP_ID=MMETSP0799-20121207/6642_1 /TAXON_ID=46947 /ORGANISM="Geminigera cryophila, Strain CCMP2564" /LENGTH=489 /DNA_ID=CAMNT_0021188997 /DNA_START=57 /DNA_END=1526 /DNA_ORIENTATION=+
MASNPQMTGIEYPAILTDGGDDRLTLNSKGVNKYHCKPEPIKDSLFRGSCTCNIPTERAYNAAEAAFKALQREEVSVGDIMDGVRSSIKTLYNLPAGTEVFLCPSGSDAEYIPLLIAKTLNKGRKIVNIVTCDAEVGSGTLDAAGGCYFSDVVPLPDDDSAGQKLNKKSLQGLAEDVETVAIPARSKKSGEIYEARDPVQEVVDRCAAENSVPIVHCVQGSKTGIFEPYPDTNFGKMVSTRDAFVVVDACQGRFKEEWLDEYLRKQAIVLITGSKFYRGPPFSGAVLVPGSIMERLILTDVDMPAGLRHFMSANEVPPALADWRSALKEEDNVGLALRWVAAIEEMEPFLELPVEVRDAAMTAWHDALAEMIAKYQGTLELMENVDCLTIVSIRLRRKQGGYLNVAQSKQVFEWMTHDMSSKLDSDVAARRCYIGQPVSLTKEECVVRVAAGSDAIRLMCDHPKSALAEDAAILAKLALLVDAFEQLSQ